MAIPAFLAGDKDGAKKGVFGSNWAVFERWGEKSFSNDKAWEKKRRSIMDNCGSE